MGCSSSRPKKDNPSGMSGDEAKRQSEGQGTEDDGVPVMHRLLLKKNERSREGRQGQSLVQNLVHDEFHRQINEVYDMENAKVLGKGGFGTVKIVTHRATKQQYALKAVELSRVKDEKSLDFVFREVEVMRSLDHPNICRLHAVYPTVDHLFMVMDLCEGGDLLTTYRFRSEREAANIVLKVTSAVRYMHDRKIAHRDLKLDNILTDSSKEGADVKLVDFGLSAHFEDFKLEHDIVGTWVYMAPEVISGSHFPRTCDMWSIGVITYLLLCGYPPFGGSSTAELKEQIQHGTYQFHQEAWSGISAMAKNFIKRLLVRNPQERMSAAEAQHHPWLNLSKPETEVNICKEAVGNISRFRAHNYLKKLALEMVARSLDPEQIRNLERCFNSMDRDGSGTISLEEFESVLATQKNLSRADIREMFEGADIDKDQMLHFNEFLAATLGRRALDERRLRLAFDRLDFDHSGNIDADDLRAIVGSTVGEEDVESIMSEFDRNKDGKIDFDEFKSTMRHVELPGAELPVVPLAMARARSLPDIKVDARSIKHLEKVVKRHALPSAPAADSTPPTSMDSVRQDSTSDRLSVISRATAAHCASHLMEKQRNRRTTVAVSNPASKRAIARSAMELRPAVEQGSSTMTTDDDQSLLELSVGPPQHEVEEPMPYGQLHVPTVDSISLSQMQDRLNRSLTGRVH